MKLHKLIFKRSTFLFALCLGLMVLVFNAGRMAEYKHNNSALENSRCEYKRSAVDEAPETDFTYNDSPTPIIEFEQAGPYATFDEYCDQHGEWSSIGNDVFIKKNAAFFFSDVSLIRIHLLRRGSLNHSFSLNVRILKRKSESGKKKNDKNKFFVHSDIAISVAKHEKVSSSSKYYFDIINARLNLTELGLQSADLNDLKFLVQVRDTLTNRASNIYVDMRVKQMSPLNFDKRKGSIVCGKCFHLSKADDYLTFRWWLEMNRLAGHDNVYVCDHAIEKHQAFTDLFDQYKDFVVFDRLKVGDSV
jgi:hypothetical protein